MEKLRPVDTLGIQQRKEWGEILTGRENKYADMDDKGEGVYWAAEEGRSLFFCFFLRALRPFTIHILESDGQTVLRLDRSFRFFFHTLAGRSPDGRCLGTVEKRFSIVRRIYSVCDDIGQERCQLFGPLLRPWTFLIRKSGEEIGRSSKKWSGLLQESLADADNFSVTFPAELPVTEKSVLLGAVFLIDFVHFEGKS